MLQKFKEIKRKLTSRNSLNNSYLNELVSSIHRANIRATIFSIFWASGPVTVIAISLGYYLSHGARVPTVTVVYFSLYVFFVGLVGFISKLIFDSIQYRKKESIQDKFLTVIDESYDNLFLSKKLNLANLTDEVKNNKIAFNILCKSHPTSKEIFYAFHLHFDKDMAEFAQIVHLHKENGFPIDSQVNRQKIIKFYKIIDTKENLPESLKLKFLEALKGEYADIKKGIERKVGFLSKIYNSSGHHGLFDLDDADHAITLFIELLSGRRIYYYKTISKFDDVKKDYLFKSIENLRYKITQKYNHIQGIYKQLFLTTSEVLPCMDLREIVNISEDTSYNLGLLNDSLKTIRVKSLDKLVKKQFQFSRDRYYQNLRIIKTLLKRLDLLLKQWHSLSFDETEQINKHNIEYELAYVQLEEKSRMQIAENIAIYLSYDNQYDSSIDKVKSFAYQAVRAIQQPVSLDQPSILTAIELSSGTNLSSVKLNNSTKQKLDVTYNLCRSVKTDINEIRKRVKRVVIAQYA